MSISADGPRRFRPRFSLLTALLLMTIVGMAIVIVQLWREVGPLRETVRRYHDEIGKLIVEDPSKIHAIEVKTHDPHVWRWRVWVPAGRNLKLAYQWGDIPRDGLPADFATTELPPGEHTITLAAVRDHRGRGWMTSLESSSGVSVGSSVPDDQVWFDWPGRASMGSGGRFSTYVENPQDEFFVLSRFRVAKPSATGLVSSADLNKDEPRLGFIIWLERQ